MITLEKDDSLFCFPVTIRAMRLSITWLIVIGFVLLLGACESNQPVVETPVSAEISPTQPTENKLPPPIVSIATAAPIPTAAEPRIVTAPNDEPPPPTATPEPLTEDISLVDGLLSAERVGNGAFKIALVTDGHSIVSMLADTYRADPGRVPPNLALWFVSASSSSDVMRSADTSFDNCTRNDGVGRPFYSAESLALRNFLDDAAFAVFF